MVKYAFSYDIPQFLDQNPRGNNYHTNISVVIITTGKWVNEAYFSISNQLKKLSQKIDTLAIVSNFLPESFSLRDCEPQGDEH